VGGTWLGNAGQLVFDFFIEPKTPFDIKNGTFPALEECVRLSSDESLGTITHRSCLIVVPAVHFSLVLYENDFSSCIFTGSHNVVVSPNDTVEVIQQTARALITRYISAEGPAVEVTLVSVSVYEV